VLFEGSGNQRPCFLQIDFAVFGEEGGKGTLFEECAGSIILRSEGVDLPFVDVIRVPRLRFFCFM
jgi:hypothetical protein